ncbi:MAG: sensor histidine kinase, partial [Candidatus Kapaibacteriota bacterium]
NNIIFKEIDVSEVFMGFRGFHHFTISVLKSTNADKHLVIRASINIEILSEKIESQNMPLYTDLFIVNQKGVLQTDSKFYGKALDSFPINMSLFSKKSDVIQTVDNYKKPILLSYSFLSNTPFILVEIAYAESLMSNWFKSRNQLILFLIVSIVIIILVVIWGSNRFIRLIKENDLKEARMMHEIEYTNKMASIGRLAAGVSHEINNPLSIINENAGMIQDILQASEDFPNKEKILQCTNSIFKSVTRCSKITHQLLGFAKKMEPKLEEINLDELITEVVSFVHREAYLNDIVISIQNLKDEIIILISDRGLLQQVFINILNNALEAISEEGKVDIAYKSLEND